MAVSLRVRLSDSVSFTGLDKEEADHTHGILLILATLSTVYRQYRGSQHMAHEGGLTSRRKSDKMILTHVYLIVRQLMYWVFRI